MFGDRKDAFLSSFYGHFELLRSEVELGDRMPTKVDRPDSELALKRHERADTGDRPRIEVRGRLSAGNAVHLPVHEDSEQRRTPVSSRALMRRRD